MIVRLTAEAPPEIVDRGRVDRLSATADGALDAMQLAPICRPDDEHRDDEHHLDKLDGEHVWVRIDALREASAPIVGDAAFDAMIAFAADRGWLDATETFVRAHVTPPA